jgi:CheY-like chemotaxis protein
MQEHPRILCVAGHRYEMRERGSREFISAMLPEYEIRFAQNEFDITELAREGRYDLILMNCIRLDGRYAKACVLIRMFDPETPVIFITDSHQMTEEDTATVGAQGVFSTADPNFVEDLRDRVNELVGRDILTFKPMKM